MAYTLIHAHIWSWRGRLSSAYEAHVATSALKLSGPGNIWTRRVHRAEGQFLYVPLLQSIDRSKPQVNIVLCALLPPPHLRLCRCDVPPSCDLLLRWISNNKCLPSPLRTTDQGRAKSRTALIVSVVSEKLLEVFSFTEYYICIKYCSNTPTLKFLLLSHFSVYLSFVLHFSHYPFLVSVFYFPFSFIISFFHSLCSLIPFFLFIATPWRPR